MTHVPRPPPRAAPPSPWSRCSPSALPPAPAGAIDITQVTSPGGIKAWLVEDHSNPVIAVNVRFTLGSADDPAGKGREPREVARRVATVDEGAGDCSIRAFQAALKDQSISLSFRAGMDATRATLMTLSDTSADAFRLFQPSLDRGPRFDRDPVQRMRQHIARRRPAQGRPTRSSRRPAELWWRAAFPDHPYGRPRDGTVDGLTAVTVGDRRTLHAGGLTRDGLTVSVVDGYHAGPPGGGPGRAVRRLPAKRQLPPVASTPRTPAARSMS